MNGLYYFIDLMQKGKAVNYIILLLYFITMATAAERFVYYFTTRYKKNTFYTFLKNLQNTDRNDPACPENLFNGNSLKNSYIPSLTAVFFEYRSAGYSMLEVALERIVQQTISSQERGLILLSRIAAAAPLLGLLGTVTGLMTAFQKIAALGGSVDIAVLSGGIWEAMITTATGLVTALFSFTLYELFDWLSMKRVQDMEQLVSYFMELHSTHDVLFSVKGSCDETV